MILILEWWYVFGKTLRLWAPKEMHIEAIESNKK
jgi:hypothetical protein